MNIEVTRTGKLLTLALEGRVDAFATKNLQETVNQKLTPDLDALITFDLKGVSHISSAGPEDHSFGCQKMKKTMVPSFCAGSGRFCRDVMDTAGFLSLLPVFDTLQEAVAFGLQCIQEKEYLQNWDQMENILPLLRQSKSNSGSLEKSEALVTGDIKDVLYSRVTREKLFPKTFRKPSIPSDWGPWGRCGRLLYRDGRDDHHRRDYGLAAHRRQRHLRFLIPKADTGKTKGTDRF